MKKAVFSLVALLAASLLFGCHGESITSPPLGGTALTSQVVTMGDLAGASPAGISVTCSGQVSVTDAAGRFAFASISAESAGQISVLSTGNYNMHFSRRDGINASGSVSSGSSNVTVYLQKSQATITATTSDGGPDEGARRSDHRHLLVVDHRRQRQHARYGQDGDHDSTVIRKGNTKLTWKDLHVGDRVHVKTTGSGDSLTATEIMLQNPA